MLALIRFRIWGNLRYLSHAETMSVFQRACTRAGIKVKYSQGFNPHPRMSLVLPRSVGVESDDEILCLWLENDNEKVESLKLPDGIEILSAQFSKTNDFPQPLSARYLVKIKNMDEPLRHRIETALKNTEIVIERRSGENSKPKMIDVRPFLEKISAKMEDIIIDCKISPAGTIRVNEILDLLQLSAADLAGPMKRIKVQWQGIINNNEYN